MIHLFAYFVLLVAFVLTVIKLLKVYKEFQRKKEMIQKFPGVDAHPIWGHLAEFPGPTEEGLIWMYEATKDYNPRQPNRVWFGPFIPSIHVYYPTSVKDVLKTSEPKPTTVGGARFALPWLGDGLLLAGGKKWSRNRRLLTPGFHFDILKPYIKISNERCDILLDKLNSLATKGDYFEVFTQISLLTLDIILRCSFSYDNDCQEKGTEHPYVNAVGKLGGAMIYRAVRPWLYPDFVYYLTPRGREYRKLCNYVHSVSENIIQQRKKSLAEHGNSLLRSEKYIDFLDILLTAVDEDGVGFCDLEIRNEVDTFLFEGHDTTASGISWTLYSLAQHPDIQKKCQQEIDDVLKGRHSDEILWEDLSKLEYLTMCIKEGLRLHSPVPVIERQTTRELQIDGFTCPADTFVAVNIYVLHHNPLVWDEPYEFRPERFSPENTKNRDPYAFVPFSAGPRNCIGQNFAMHEMKVAIARILRRFTLEVDPDRTAKHEIVVVMKTESGMYMKVKHRGHKA